MSIKRKPWWEDIPLDDNDDAILGSDWRTASVPENFKVVAVGDVVVSHPIGDYIRKDSPNLIRLLQSGAVVIGNYEGTAIDLQTFDGYPEAESGFSWLLSTADSPADLARMGFNMMSRANNHATDWGVKGMACTDVLLTQAGLVHAGTGRSLTAASAPAFLNSRGPFQAEAYAARASLVSWTTTFEANSPAVDASAQTQARPGLNPLRTSSVVKLKADEMAHLKALRAAVPRDTLPPLIDTIEQKLGVTYFGGQLYAPEPSTDTDTPAWQREVTPNVNDVARILLNIKQAKQSSDFAIAAQHCHEPANWSKQPSAFVSELAKLAIRNGADMLCGHGPHQLRGVQIYMGKPILYSLGDFVFTDNARQAVPHEEWENPAWSLLNSVLPPAERASLDPRRMTAAAYKEWSRSKGLFAEAKWFQSVVAAATYGADGDLRRLQFYPVELHHATDKAWIRGIPRLVVDEPAAQDIANQLAEVSEPFQTRWIHRAGAPLQPELKRDEFGQYFEVDLGGADARQKA